MKSDASILASISRHHGLVLLLQLGVLHLFGCEKGVLHRCPVFRMLLQHLIVIFQGSLVLMLEKIVRAYVIHEFRI